MRWRGFHEAGKPFEAGVFEEFGCVVTGGLRELDVGKKLIGVIDPGKGLGVLGVVGKSWEEFVCVGYLTLGFCELGMQIRFEKLIGSRSLFDVEPTNLFAALATSFSIVFSLAASSSADCFFEDFRLGGTPVCGNRPSLISH